MAASSATPLTQVQWRVRLRTRYLLYLAGLVGFTGLMYGLERANVPRTWLVALFLMLPVVLYASIGWACKTSDPTQYFVGGRSVPAVYNGMAIGADWMSVASYMGLTGLMYTHGFGGMAYVLGWTGGFCLIAFFIAPALRKAGLFTIPDFLGERYGGRLPRLVGLVVTSICSLMYVVAQIYGIGLVTSRLTGFGFEMGIFVGLGGVLVCSFVGGMRAVTWTQVAQYLVLLVAFLVPTVWLAVKHTGVWVPQFAMGQQLHEVSQREQQLIVDPGEQQVIATYRREADRYAALLKDVDRSLAQERDAAMLRLDRAQQGAVDPNELRAARRAVQNLPQDADTARQVWTRARDRYEAGAQPLAGMVPQAQPFAGDPQGSAQQQQRYQRSKVEFLTLVFCLMAGTAGMPHLLARFYTTPTVREARQSVTWALLFIVLLYISAPALAIALKHEILYSVVGARFDELPRWIAEWSKLYPSLVSVSDVNHDGVLQLGELRISGDVLVLAAPEIGGMPFVLSCLVAAGGLAAALSTADGLLLTIANALSHDLLHKVMRHDIRLTRQVAISKVALLLVALVAAYIALQRPAGILLLITPVFSIAAATIFPALLLGIVWRRANHWGVVTGMLAGLSMTLYYMLTRPGLLQSSWFGAPRELWCGVAPEAAGVFGVPAAFAVAALVSWLTPPDAEGRAWSAALQRNDTKAMPLRGN
jgi:cation/acetate symporter